MRLTSLTELHYITPIENVRSILTRGILSHNGAHSLRPSSVAMPEIQELRSGIRVPNGGWLHDYVNLYLCARNPMLYKRKELHEALCVLRVATEVLRLPNVVIADGNAASKWTAFRPSPGGLDMIDEGMLFAESWVDVDEIVGYRKKRVKCAEVLVPDCVPARHILGCYVSCPDASVKLRADGCSLDSIVDGHLFFRS